MGVTMKTTEQVASETGRVAQDGYYTLGEGRFRIMRGDVLPDGATFVGSTEPAAADSDAAADDEPERRTKGNAPENRALGGAPQNRIADASAGKGKGK